MTGQDVARQKFHELTGDGARLKIVFDMTHSATDVCLRGLHCLCALYYAAS